MQSILCFFLRFAKKQFRCDATLPPANDNTLIWWCSFWEKTVSAS